MVAFLPLTSFSIVAGFFLPEVLGLHNVTVDDTDPRIVYSGVWRATLPGNGMDVGGTQMVADVDPDAYATFTFTGVALYFHSPKWPYHTNTDLSLDGGPITTIDLRDYAHPALVASGATVQSTVVASWVGLANTQHTLLASKGKNGPFAVLDALTYTVLDAADVAGMTSTTAPIKASYKTWRNSRRDVSDGTSTFLGLPAIVGLVIAIIFVKLMICIWCVWFRKRRYVRAVRVYPPGPAFPPPPPPYQPPLTSPLFPLNSNPNPITPMYPSNNSNPNPIFPTNTTVNPPFPSSPPISSRGPPHPAYPLTPVSPYGPPRPAEQYNPYGYNSMPTRRPGSGPITTPGNQQPKDVFPNLDDGKAVTTFPAAVTTFPAAVTTFPAAVPTFPAAATTFPAAATTFPAAVPTFPSASLSGRESREPFRQDPRITQADGLATPNPATASTTPGKEVKSVRPSSGGDVPPPPEYTPEDNGQSSSRTAGGSDGRPTASNVDGSGRVSEFSVPQPLSFMPIN